MEALKKFYIDLNNTFIKIAKLLKDKPYTEDYYNNTFLKDYNSVINWLNESLTNQSQISLAEKPILTAEKINSKSDIIRRSYYKMTQVKKPKEEKKNDKKVDSLFDEDNLEELIKKYNVTREEIEKMQKEIEEEMKLNKTKNNDTIVNETNFNDTNDKKDVDKKNEEVKSDL